MVSPSQLDRAFSETESTRDSGRQEIIDSGSVDDFWECVDYARKHGRTDDLEFWLIEIATSGLDAEVLASGLIALAKEILEPQGRVYEALIYLRYIAPALFGDQHAQVLEFIERFDTQLSEETRVESTEGWRDYDLTGRLETGHDQQHYYDRFLAYFHATNNDERKQLMETFRSNFLPNIIGFFQGLMGSIGKYGVKSETVVKAFDDFWKAAYPDIKPGIPRRSTGGGYQAPSTTMPTPQTSQPKTGLGGYGVTKS